MLFGDYIKGILTIIFAVFAINNTYGQQSRSLTAYERNKSYLSTNVKYDTGEILRSIDYYGRKLSDIAPDSALILLQSTLKESTRLNFQQGVVHSLFCIGHVYSVEGNYQQAIEYFYETIKAAEKISDVQMCGMGYRRLAAIFTQLKQNEKAFFYFGKAENIARKTGDMESLAKILYNNASIYYEQEKWDSATIYYDSIILIADKHNFRQLKCLALSNLSYVYFKKNKLKQALSVALEAEHMRGDMQLYVYANLDLILGAIYLELKNYKASEFYLFKALRISEQTKSIVDLMSVNETLSKVYLQTKEYKRAYERYKVYTALKDSIESKEVTENINKLEIKFRTVQKDKEIATQQLLINQKENKLKTKNLWIWGIASFSFVLAVMFFILFTGYRRRQQLQATTIRNMQQEQKIGQLTAMMQGEEKERTRIARELHDGIGGLLSASKMNFSSLHYLYDESPVFHNGIKLLDDAYDELRKTAHNLLPETLLQEGLVKALWVFCNKIDKQSLDISFQALGDLPRLNAETELSLYRIAQELINNVLKHAKASKALVQIDLQDDQLLVTVEDNGKGFAENIDICETGIGLKNLASRINALGGQMEVDSRTSIGTTVYLEFNIHKFQTVEIE